MASPSGQKVVEKNIYISSSGSGLSAEFTTATPRNRINILRWKINSLDLLFYISRLAFDVPNLVFDV